MFKTVTEDGPRGPKQTGLIMGQGWLGLSLIVVTAFTLAATDVSGQQTDETAAFRASVLDLAEAYERITVPVNRSATVETTVEVQRADVIARQIAEVRVISPTRVLITGQSFGNTSVVLLGADDKQYVFEVTVELDLEALNEALKGVDPQTTARATSLYGNIVLTGTASSPERAQRMAELARLFLPPAAQGGREAAVQNHLEIAGEQQVRLNCIVAEVSRAAARELGVNGFLIGENFRDGFVINQLGGINPINIGAAGASLVTENVPFLTNNDGINVSPATTFSLGFPRAQTQLFFRAMAENNLLRVLAEPNLVAISGETATFLAGGEFPILVPQGDFRATIEFREFGVRLNFTPVVRGHQLIRLRVAPEVSEQDFTAAVQFEGFVVPGLTSRSAQTTIELGNGQTIAIAGLLKEEVRGLASRIPGLGDLPVLGALFRSVQYRRAQTELVILVTPEIVAPMDAHQKVRLPGEDLGDPNDFELYALGLLEPRAGEGNEPDDGSGMGLESEPDELSIHGPWGHAADDEVR